MPLPLPQLTFVRMAEVTPSSTTIDAYLDAIFNGGNPLTDYRGVAVPLTHRWTWTKRQTLGITEAITITPPAGTAMGKAPAIIFGGRALIGTPVTPTPASPDAMSNSLPYVGLSKNSGAYVSWDAALPFGPGSSWFGFWRTGAASVLATTTYLRVFISQETILLQAIEAGGNAQYWAYIGALGEPYDADTSVSGETDNRLYGQIVSGSSTSVSSSWLNTQSVFGHSTSASAPHGGVLTPNAGTIIPCGRLTEYPTAGTTAQPQTPSGVYAAEAMAWAQSPATFTPTGSRMGTIRGIYPIGLMQSGRILRNGTTDLFHVVSTSTIAADDALLLPAVP